MSDVRGARIARMMADPDCGGDLLLLGCAFSAFLDFGMLTGPKFESEDVARNAWSTSDMYAFRFKETIRNDARQYKPPRPRGGRGLCMAPMIRRDTPCGRRTSRSGYLTDWATGEMTWHSACTKHLDWFQRLWWANRDAKPETPPLPVANHGGVLARYFPEVAWVPLWKWADPTWVEHPEAKPWPKPTLTLHVGDGDTAPGGRALLVPVGAS